MAIGDDSGSSVWTFASTIFNIFAAQPVQLFGVPLTTRFLGGLWLNTLRIWAPLGLFIPAPLNNRCNPYISRQVPEFEDSCELAKVALTVWTANQEAFAAFDGFADVVHPPVTGGKKATSSSGRTLASNLACS